MSQAAADDVFRSAAAGRGPLVLEAQELSKDFRIGRGPHGAVLSAVRSVSLQLYRSAVVALVGESGSGKSTVAKLLAGQEVPTAGRILLDGENVAPANGRAFRRYKRDVQLLFQDPVRIPQPGAQGALSARAGRAAPSARAPGCRCRGRAGEAARRGPPHARRALPRALPARAVGRPAPARRDRSGARGQATRAARRRAGVDARRLDPPRGPGRHRPAAEAPSADRPLHHPRHRLGALFRRRDARHVCGRDRRARALRRS